MPLIGLFRSLMKSACYYILFFIVLPIQMAVGQEKCATVPYNQHLQELEPATREERVFEKWIKSRLAQKSKLPRLLEKKETEVYRIPVVVHVIHNGENIGTGGNISKEQILSQIKVLNEDYRRLNFDTIYTPSLFLPVAIDTYIEFELANRDPGGAQTEGIVRLRGTQSSWDANSTIDDRKLKSLSFWPPEDYLNIWVTNISGTYLGYAQYPETNLPGALPPYDRETDGVVIDYTVFGSINDGSFPEMRLNYDRGRTTTHEIGHYFGLRHIWGDGGCGATDYCDDTPDQESSYASCANIDPFSCGSEDMFQNYMDYTYDVCMNLFTYDQMQRMRIVLENSPRRYSLLNSPGLMPPDFFPNTLIVRDIISPDEISCSAEFGPEIRIQNIGSNAITQFEIEFILDVGTFPLEFYEVDLQPGESTTIDLSDITNDLILQEGQHFMQVSIIRPNGVEGLSYEGKTDSRYFLINTSEDIIPLREAVSSLDMDELPWGAYNPDNAVGWEVVTAPYVTGSNQAFGIELFNYSSLGAKDWLVSPLLDMSESPTANMTFDLSYASYDTIVDLLEIRASLDCGATFPFTVYRAPISDLSEQNSTEFWIPRNAGEWQRYYVELDDFAGENPVRLAFITTNGNGNNLYLDNIEFYQTGFTRDISLAENTLLIHPNPSTDGFFYVTVDAPRRQRVEIRILDSMGKKIMERQFDNLLNQTIEFDLNGYRNGIYLIQISGESFNKSQRVVVNR